MFQFYFLSTSHFSIMLVLHAVFFSQTFYQMQPLIQLLSFAVSWYRFLRFKKKLKLRSYPYYLN